MLLAIANMKLWLAMTSGSILPNEKDVVPLPPLHFNGFGTMKRFLMMTWLLMCAALCVVAQGNRIYMEDVEITPDSSLTVPLMLTNVDETRGVQFNMVLPQGLQLVDQDLTDYSYDIGMKLTTRHLAEQNTWIVIVHSMEKAYFPAGNATAIMEFCFKAAKDFKGGKIILNNMRGSTFDNRSIKVNDDSTTVTVLPNTLMRRQQADDDQDQFFN